MGLAQAIDATTVEQLLARGSLKWTYPPAGEIGAFVAEMDFGTVPAGRPRRCTRRSTRPPFGYLPAAMAEPMSRRVRGLAAATGTAGRWTRPTCTRSPTWSPG